MFILFYVTRVTKVGTLTMHIHYFSLFLSLFTMRNVFFTRGVRLYTEAHCTKIITRKKVKAQGRNFARRVPGFGKRGAQQRVDSRTTDD